MTNENQPDDADEPLVWYAAYGSNLFSERFACYIHGGKAPGASKPNRGSEDEHPPLAERAMFIPHQLYFAQRSGAWGNKGVAFVSAERDAAAATLGRAWLISVTQFHDLVAQENGRDESACDLDAVVADGFHDADSGWYRRALLLDTWDDVPVITITSPTQMEANPPSADYLTCVVAGLRETYGFNQQAVRKYLKGQPGIAAEAINRAYDHATKYLPEE